MRSVSKNSGGSEYGNGSTGKYRSSRKTRVLPFTQQYAIVLAISLGAVQGRGYARQDVVPGIQSYRVILPAFTNGPDGQTPADLADSLKNMGGDISDRGLVAGRVELASVGLRGFVWSVVPQFGLGAQTVTWLRMPVDDSGKPFPSSEAFDVSEHGVVVGGAGWVAGLQPPPGGAVCPIGGNAGSFGILEFGREALRSAT